MFIIYLTIVKGSYFLIRSIENVRNYVLCTPDDEPTTSNNRRRNIKVVELLKCVTCFPYSKSVAKPVRN